MARIEEKMKKLGLELPNIAKPVAAYVPTVRVGNLVYISGQGVTRDGKALMTGHVGAELSVEDGYEGARICALNALAALKQEIGDLDKVRRIVKVLGFVNSAPGFEEQPYVINGFSETMERIFGDKGRHARSAISANELPFGTPVEVEMIVEVEA